MCRLREAIDRECDAADELTQACVDHGALVDATSNENVFVTALKRKFRASWVSPNDMLTTLGKIK